TTCAAVRTCWLEISTPVPLPAGRPLLSTMSILQIQRHGTPVVFLTRTRLSPLMIPGSSNSNSDDTNSSGEKDVSPDPSKLSVSTRLDCVPSCSKALRKLFSSSSSPRCACHSSSPCPVKSSRSRNGDSSPCDGSEREGEILPSAVAMGFPLRAYRTATLPAFKS